MKKLVSCILMIASALALGQNQYAETLSPNNMASGVYYQTGPGSNNTLNWSYPYGTKLTVLGVEHRNFELLATSYPYGQLKIRQWDPTNDVWSAWRGILTENDEGKFSAEEEIRIEDKGEARENSFLRISRGSAGKDRALVSYGDDGNYKWHTGLLYGGGWSTPDFHISQEEQFRDGNGNYLQEPEFTIKSNGDVGIGTRTPDSKLAVNGNIHAKEVKVDLVGWPDYVFKEDYDLPTLKKVEQHIKEKGHLINIPSAKEVEENGVQLGEMNKLLLEKIEELTLYILKQQKEIDKTKDIEKRLLAVETQNIQLLKKLIAIEKSKE
ncbi:hypothetical protein MTsPCn5_16420 [Croceitalea sp. MTPC5]|uniref:hypothetical protein n=1 Tax=Croceitalea sp. MTPC5 TaxID=3056565 RepID=UPI002B369951|nr:hypothetical protein MTsPCn5_16420 [Croceitalea sp. MTPC5]